MLATRYYYMGGFLRLTTIYVIVGSLAAAAIASFTPGDKWLLIAIFVNFARYLFLKLFWCLRVDDEGIARRGWLGALGAWDVWRWEDFATGTIQKRNGFQFFDPARPWGWRTLSLNALSKEDWATLLRLIHAYYVLPPALPPSESLTISYSWRCTAAFDAAGIHLNLRGQRSFTPWSDVLRLRIVRIDPLRHDFRSFKLTLPERQLAWSRSKNEPPAHEWNGASSEALNSLLLAYVPEDRVVVHILGEDPPLREDLEPKIQQLRSGLRRASISFNGFLLPVLSMLLICQAIENIFAAAVMCGLFVSFLLPLCLLVHRDVKSQIRQLEELAKTCA